MYRVQPRYRRYSGEIILGPQPRNWISRHRSFASREWFESQVRYGKWIRKLRGPRNHYYIYPIVPEGQKRLTIEIEIHYHPHGTSENPFDHVWIQHSHILR